MTLKKSSPLPLAALALVAGCDPEGGQPSPTETPVLAEPACDEIVFRPENLEALLAFCEVNPYQPSDPSTGELGVNESGDAFVLKGKITCQVPDQLFYQADVTVLPEGTEPARLSLMGHWDDSEPVSPTNLPSLKLEASLNELQEPEGGNERHSAQLLDQYYQLGTGELQAHAWVEQPVGEPLKIAYKPYRRIDEKTAVGEIELKRFDDLTKQEATDRFSQEMMGGGQPPYLTILVDGAAESTLDIGEFSFCVIPQ